MSSLNFYKYWDKFYSASLVRTREAPSFGYTFFVTLDSYKAEKRSTFEFQMSENRDMSTAYVIANDHAAHSPLFAVSVLTWCFLAIFYWLYRLCFHYVPLSEIRVSISLFFCRKTLHMTVHCHSATDLQKGNAPMRNLPHEQVRKTSVLRSK